MPEPAGTRGYDDLRRRAERPPLGQGLRPAVASLDDHARMLAALDREQDHQPLATLQRLIELEQGLRRRPRSSSDGSSAPPSRSLRTGIAGVTQMHPGAELSPYSVYACTPCRAAASNDAQRRRVATSSRATGRADHSSLGTRPRRGSSCARRTTSNDSPTPAARPPRRSASVAPPSGGCSRTSKRSRCPGAQLIPVDELERVAVERRRTARATTRAGDAGTQAAVRAEVAKRIHEKRSAGKSLRQIADDLNGARSRRSTVGRSGGRRPFAPSSSGQPEPTGGGHQPRA